MKSNIKDLLSNRIPEYNAIQMLRCRSSVLRKMREWVSVCCLTSNEHGFSCNMKHGDKELEWMRELVLFNTKWQFFQKQVTFNAMMIRPLCTKPTRLVRFFNFSSLKHLSPGIHVVPLGHIILILSQPVLIAP